MPDNESRDSWHLSKSVPIGLILALLFHASAVVWYGSQWTAAISENRKDIEQLNQGFIAIAKDSQAQAVQLARIEENTRFVGERVAELVRQLERRQEQK